MEIRGILTGVSPVENHSDFCKFQIGDNTVYAAMSMAEVLTMTGTEVIVNVRRDMLNGESVLMVNDTLTVVHTADKTEQNAGLTKMCVVPEMNYASDFFISEICYGARPRTGVCLFLRFSAGSSNKASWVDLECLDRASKLFTVRVFRSGTTLTDEWLASLQGKYIQMSIKLTRYGYNGEDIFEVPVEVASTPNTTVARMIVEEAMNKDEGLRTIQTLANGQSSLDALEKVYAPIPGHGIITLAARLQIIDQYCQLTSADGTALKRAVCVRAIAKVNAKKNVPAEYAESAVVLTSPVLRSDFQLMSILTAQDSLAYREYKACEDFMQAVLQRVFKEVM